MNDLERRERSVAMVASRKAMAAAVFIASLIQGPSIIHAVREWGPLHFYGGLVIGGGGGPSAGDPTTPPPSYDPPATPTIDAFVRTATSVVFVGSAFSGDGDDTHAASIFQVDELAGDWSTPVAVDTLGAVERDSITSLTTDVAYKGRVKYEGTNGGYGAYSDSVAVTPTGVPTPAFVLDFEDFANNSAFKGASQLTHRCSPDFPNCTGDAGVDTELVSATTALGSTKAGRCYYAHRDSASVYGESDILCTIRWDIPGGTNSAVNLIHGEFRHSNTAVGDATSWKHDGVSGLHKTQFVNGNGFARVAEMKFGSDILEAKYNNNQFGDSRSVSDPNYVWNGQWYEYCQLVIVNTASGIYNLKVDTLVVATLTGRDYASSSEISTIELGVNSLPNPSPVGATNSFMEWGRHEIYTDTAGVAAAYSVCDFSGDG